MPAFGITEIGRSHVLAEPAHGLAQVLGADRAVQCRRRRARIARRIVATAAMSVPSSMRPVTSSATCTWSGTRRPASLEGQAGAVDRRARLEHVLHRLDHAAGRRRPPAAPCACWRKSSASSSKPIVGERRVVARGQHARSGPSSRRRSAAGRRSRSSSQATRARRAASRLSSNVTSSSPHSSSRMRVDWKEFVSTASAPASRYARWMPSIRSGRVEREVVDVALLAAEVAGRRARPPGSACPWRRRTRACARA